LTKKKGRRLNTTRGVKREWGTSKNTKKKVQKTTASPTTNKSGPFNQNGRDEQDKNNKKGKSEDIGGGT